MSAPSRGRAPAGRVIAALLVLSLTAPALADSRALADVPIPPNAESRTISTDIVQNGLSTSIASLVVRGPIDDTIAFYRDAWPATENDPGHAEERHGEWSIVSRVDGDALLVVQLRDGASGPEGLVSAMSRAGPAGVASPPPPMPAGGQLLSSLNTRDAGSVALTSVVSSTARPGEVAAFYRDHLVRDGWRLASDRVDGGASVLLFDRHGARLEVVVSDVDGQSIAVVNEVRLDG